MRYSVDVAVTENGYTLLSVTPLDDKLYEQYVETPQEVDTAIARNNITAFQRAVAGSAEVEVSTCENELTSNSNIQPMGTTQGNYTYHSYQPMAVQC